MKLTIIIPCFNEEKTILDIVLAVKKSPIKQKEIIIVDDCSTDGTKKILHSKIKPLVSHIIYHKINQGKGAALRTGFRHAGGPYVGIQDADLEYDPSDIPKLLAPLFDGVADVVYGTRFRGGETQRAHLFWHYAGNRFLSLLTNILYNTTISDMEVGYKAFNGELIRSIKLVSNDFAFEPEVTAKVLRHKNIRLFEVAISYYGRTYEEGKKITWRDGFSAVAALIRFRFGG